MDDKRKVTYEIHSLNYFYINFVFFFFFRVSPDIKDAALCTGVKLSNDTDVWRKVFDVYTTSKSASEKNSAQTALTCTRDTSLLYK